MPIITPAFPSMCSTHTVMPSTLRIMQEEFQRADQIMQHIFAGTKGWDALFERHSFFTKDHKYYLTVVAASRTQEAHERFNGLVQSKVRHIVKGIDDGQTGIDTARPYPKCFERVHKCTDEDQVFEVSQGSLQHIIPASEVPPEGSAPEGSAPANGDTQFMYTASFYIGLTVTTGTSEIDFAESHQAYKESRWRQGTRHLLPCQSVPQLHYGCGSIRRQDNVCQGSPHPQVSYLC